jgi:preprotein translocase subunit YajC
MIMYWIIAEASAGGNTEGTVLKMEPAASGTNAKTNPPTPPPPTNNTNNNMNKNAMWQLAPFILLLALMYLMLFRGPKKRQQEQQKMVSSLKKNDRVLTTGGILGTIIDARDDEIILKIDEATNTKMRIVPSAILKVLGDDKKNQ